MAVPFGVIYIALAAYTLTRSTINNFLLVSVITALAKLVYNLVLYPDFFTPIKHIPTPAVSHPWYPRAKSKHV